jgi:DNA repair protein RadC
MGIGSERAEGKAFRLAGACPRPPRERSFDDVSAEPATAERPRERLRAVGARALAVRELVALLVGSGSGRGTAGAVADRILGRAGESLRRLAALDVGALEAVSGVGIATAARILAALELGRRAAAEAPSERPRIQGPGDVHLRLGPRLRDLAQEEFHALLLDTRHRLLREVLVTRGTLDASLITPREVFRLAVLEGAAAVILVHNHPSGDPTPSPDDRASTRQLAQAGRALGIPVLDHVIVGDGRFVSLAEEGALE